MEVCFADVGQGTSNVILLGSRRAIVIDCGGAQARTVLAILRRFQVEIISRLIISHSHDDHSRGAAAVLTAFQGRIEELWMLDDVRRSKSLFWKRVQEQLRANHLNRQQIRLLVREDKPKQIYRDNRVLLSLIAPDCVTNFTAVDDRDPNFTSAVLVLKRDKQQIVFAGDSTIATWQDIIQRRTRPFKCDILAVPHHAGGIWKPQQTGESEATFQNRIQAELNWLYTSAVKSKFGIVSVGTNNTYAHPRPEVISAMRRAGITPICTQMTPQCMPDLETQRRSSLPLVMSSRSVLRVDVNGRGRSRNVPCAGTILVELRDNSIEIQRFADHQAMIDNMNNNSSGTALCRS